MAELTVGPVEELPPGEVKIVRAGELAIGVYNLNGEYYAIEDRCSHDDGPLAEGDFDVESGVAICPRHGSEFDVRTGRPLSLPAYQPVETFEVFVEDGLVKVKV
ncbi:MAG TPA: non-heme iron oxygenase ferredoxin subunit [Gaiellaceae bacterium]|nr:non-heme iron oxygenase ferredoxin subunit [Gaiellaceae bacterium]